MPPARGTLVRQVVKCDMHKDTNRHASLQCPYCRLACNKCKKVVPMTNFHKDRGWVKPLCNSCQTRKVVECDQARRRLHHVQFGKAVAMYLYKDAVESVKTGGSAQFDFCIDQWEKTVCPSLGIAVGVESDSYACAYSQMVHEVMRGRKPQADMFGHDYTAQWACPPVVDQTKFEQRRSKQAQDEFWKYVFNRMDINNVSFVAMKQGKYVDLLPSA